MTMPPLPSAWIRLDCDPPVDNFSADQMHAYAKAYAAQEVAADVNDRELMRVFWSLKPDKATERALTYTQWKDGIDIEVPTLFFQQFAAAIAALAQPPAQPEAQAEPVALPEADVYSRMGNPAYLESTTRRLVESYKAAYDEEARKFQAETLRTSELIQMLVRWMEQANNEGCRAEAWTKGCSKCDLMRETKALLDKPINASPPTAAAIGEKL